VQRLDSIEVAWERDSRLFRLGVELGIAEEEAASWGGSAHTRLAAQMARRSVMMWQR